MGPGALGAPLPVVCMIEDKALNIVHAGYSDE
jgi:hypothetical protein